MKIVLAVILIFALVFTLAGCQSEAIAKIEIFNLVEKNYDAIMKACIEQDSDALYAIEGIKDVEITDGYVLVYCKGAGIVPSSQDYGFYYSEDNRPVAVDCNLYILCDTEDLTPKGNGYQYIDSGYNVFYTEHIKGNIYFYGAYY